MKYHANLAHYFSAQPHFFDGNHQKKPHIRKCMEQPFQQTKSQLWDEVTNTLCNLEFIQAKARYVYQTPRGLEDTLGFKKEPKPVGVRSSLPRRQAGRRCLKEKNNI